MTGAEFDAALAAWAEWNLYLARTGERECGIEHTEARCVQCGAET